MKYLLSPGNIDVLAQMAWSHTLVAFDFDGTLAPIVADRNDARMRASTRRLLVSTCALFPTAIISGRSRTDVEARLAGVPVTYVVGNHGMETSAPTRAARPIVPELRTGLAMALESLPGIDIEDKRYSLAIHYRKSRRKREARAAILEAIAGLSGAPRVVLGKYVVNVLPKGAPHKGTALEALRTREGADTAIFVGDDITDEDVFEIDQPGRLLGIRVGRSTTSAASYYLQGQREIDRLLEQLLRFGRERQDAGAPIRLPTATRRPSAQVDRAAPRSHLAARSHRAVRSRTGDSHGRGAEARPAAPSTTPTTASGRAVRYSRRER